MIALMLTEFERGHCCTEIDGTHLLRKRVFVGGATESC